jgi:hypothetical protein
VNRSLSHVGERVTRLHRPIPLQSRAS